MPELESTGAEQNGEVTNKYDHLFTEAQEEVAAEAPKSTEAGDAAAHREQTRQEVFKRRGEYPTEDQLDYIDSARKEGKWL